VVVRRQVGCHATLRLITAVGASPILACSRSFWAGLLRQRSQIWITSFRLGLRRCGQLPKFSWGGAGGTGPAALGATAAINPPRLASTSEDPGGRTEQCLTPHARPVGQVSESEPSAFRLVTA